MPRSVVYLLCLLCLWIAPAAALELLAEGLGVETVLELAEGESVRLEAVRNDAYGQGVLVGRAEEGFVHVARLAGGEPAPLATIGPFAEGVELITMRFDTSGHFGRRLLLSVNHDGGLGRGNVVSDIWAVAPDGAMERLVSLGSRKDPVTLNFEVSDGERGYKAGLYLQDRNLVGGSTMVHLSPDLRLEVIGKNFLPKGRRDLDVRGMRFDPNGLYSSMLFLADADDHDKVSGIYLLDDRLRWTEVVRPEPLKSVSYGELAFGTGGTFDLALYAVERVKGRVVQISPSGGSSDFVTGFRSPSSITISADGEAMYVSDAEAIYRIGASPAR